MKTVIEINDSYVPGLASKFYQHDDAKEPLSKEQQEQIVIDHYMEIIKRDVSSVISVDPDVQAKEAELKSKEQELIDLKAQKLADAIPSADLTAEVKPKI